MKILKYLTFALILGLVFYGFDAAATNNETTIWKNVGNVLIRTFKNVRTVVYVIGAFGLIGIAIGGIVGKINFKWLGYLAAGLAIVAVADWVITIATGARTSTSTTTSFKLENDWAKD